MISLDDMARLAEALSAAEDDVETKDKQLKEAKEKLRALIEETIPGVMKELGVKQYILDNGQKVSSSQEVYASILKSDEPKVYKWLDDNNFGGLIKTKVVALYNKGEKASAVALAQTLNSQGVDVEVTQTVHSSTLKAFIKERLATGEPFPLDMFGARAVQKAKIK